MSASNDQTPVIDPNPTLQGYYSSLESRIGYRLFLGDTRHFGYYESASSWPFAINKSLRAMEATLLSALNLSPGSMVLDAGCGVGHVALYMAQHGKLQVKAIDVVPRHVNKAQRNIENARMGQAVTAQRMDYHHLDNFADASFNGIYTMETVVHATDPSQVLSEFYRVLRPGGRIALNEYDHMDLKAAPQDLAESMKKVNEYAAMPANAAFDQGVLEELLKEAGFEDVQLKDLSQHIWPMLWLFYIVAIVPYLFIKFFGLEMWFVNTLAGVESYRGRHLWRYVQVTARKPTTTTQTRKSA